MAGQRVAAGVYKVSLGATSANSATPPRESPFTTTPPTNEQRVALIDAAFDQEPQFGALVHLGLVARHTTRRTLGLRWCDIDVTNTTVHIVHQADPDGTLRPTKTGSATRRRDRPRHGTHAEAAPFVLRGGSAGECDETITEECFVFSPRARQSFCIPRRWPDVALAQAEQDDQHQLSASPSPPCTGHSVAGSGRLSGRRGAAAWADSRSLPSDLRALRSRAEQATWRTQAVSAADPVLCPRRSPSPCSEAPGGVGDPVAADRRDSTQRSCMSPTAGRSR